MEYMYYGYYYKSMKQIQNNGFNNGFNNGLNNGLNSGLIIPIKNPTSTNK